MSGTSLLCPNCETFYSSKDEFFQSGGEFGRIAGILKGKCGQCNYEWPIEVRRIEDELAKGNVGEESQTQV